MSPSERAASHRHTAAVCRSEAEVRRDRQPDFAAWLDTLAESQDRKADEAAADEQLDLFAPTHRKAA